VATVPDSPLPDRAAASRRAVPCVSGAHRSLTALHPHLRSCEVCGHAETVHARSPRGCWACGDTALRARAAALTSRRKAERAEMARQVVDLAREHGLTAEHKSEQPGTRRTAVYLAGPHGLKLTVEFDGAARNGLGQSASDVYVLSWHGVNECARLDPSWFGSVNPYHGHKATDVAHGFEALMRVLRVRFAAIAGGYAFILASEVPAP
jgi:hypothetical protein